MRQQSCYPCREQGNNDRPSLRPRLAGILNLHAICECKLARISNDYTFYERQIEQVGELTKQGGALGTSPQDVCESIQLSTQWAKKLRKRLTCTHVNSQAHDH